MKPLKVICRAIVVCAVSVMVCASVVTSCKTSEENYRKAYDKAIAGRDESTPIENTIYGKYRRSMQSTPAVIGTDTVDIYNAILQVTEGGGGIRENLKPYSVVVGEFKQLMHAKSLRERIVDAGYPTAFVAQNAEPYYFVVLSSWPNREDAVKECIKIRKDKKLPIQPAKGMPIIIFSRR